MIVAFIVAFLIVFAAIVFVVGVIADAKNNSKVTNLCFLIARNVLTISLVCVICFTLFVLCYSMKPIKPSAKEYPASEYELKYKIADYDGKSDTTYVLIPLKLKEQQENGKKAIEKERMRIRTNRYAK